MIGMITSESCPPFRPIHLSGTQSYPMIDYLSYGSTLFDHFGRFLPNIVPDGEIQMAEKLFQAWVESL
jgi:hypothetical protein